MIDDELEAKLLRARSRIFSAMEEEIDDEPIPTIEWLALFAYTTGHLIALQDQRTVTPEAAMDLVMRNITAGNKAALQPLLQVNGKPN